MKESTNPKGAGRKPKYKVPFTLTKVPNPILEKVEKLSEPYLTPKKNEKRT